jgi:hypothetical protein
VRQYRVCGLTIASDRVLPELAPSRPIRDPDWTVRTHRAVDIRPSWFQHVNFPDGRRWMSIARGRGRYVVKFWRLATFEIRLSTRQIRSMPAGRTPARTVRHLLLDQVVPLLAASRNRIALHASAVAAEGGAVAFVGGAGKGKSTIAALLAQAGCPVIADDCLLVERRRGRLVAVPNYPGVRLWPDAMKSLFAGGAPDEAPVAHYTTKRRVGASALPFARAPIPLARIYILGSGRSRRGPDVAIRPRGQVDSLFDLLKFVQCLDIGDRTRISAAFELVGAIVGSTPVKHLMFRRKLSRLHELRDAVLADVRR